MEKLFKQQNKLYGGEVLSIGVGGTTCCADRATEFSTIVQGGIESGG